MRVTKHGEERIRERLGATKKNYEKMASRALEKGLTQAETTGKLEKYLIELFKNNNLSFTHMRVYMQMVWLFTEQDILVTVLHLPTHLVKIYNKLQKKKNEQMKGINDEEELCGL